MIDLALLFFMGIFSFTDIRENKIPNIVMFPAVLATLYKTHFFIEALIAFFLLAFLSENGWFIKWAGGDVKLFTLIAAFKGWMFIPIFILTCGIVNFYRFWKNYRLGIPLAPFATLATIIILQLTATLKWISH